MDCLDLGSGISLVIQQSVLEHPQKRTQALDSASIAGATLIGVCAAGARPIAFLNSLCLGELSHPETRSLLASVITGVADYSNRCGAPGIGGSLVLDDGYQGTSILQSCCIGVRPTLPCPEASASSAGGRIYFAGAHILNPSDAHGAHCDPFLGSRLCEASLELHSHGLVHAIEGIGLGGLAQAAGALAAAAQTGVDIDFQKVPAPPHAVMNPERILAPGSECLLVLARTGQEVEVERILRKWEIPCADIGASTDSQRLVIRHGDPTIVDIPLCALQEPIPSPSNFAEGSPEPAPVDDAAGLDSIPDDSRPMEDLTRLLSWPAIASKNWIYSQFDQTVGNGSVLCPGTGPAVVRIESHPMHREALPAETQGAPGAADRLLAVTATGIASSVGGSPLNRGRLAVIEAARKLACVGAVPWSAAVVLSSPEEAPPRSAANVFACVEGISEAFRALTSNPTRNHLSLRHLPTSSPSGPTSLTVTMLGLIERSEHVTTSWFRNDGDAVLVIGDLSDSSDPWAGLRGSAYLQAIHGKHAGTPTPGDPGKAKNLHTALLGLIQSGGITSARGCSAGGLAVALAKSCIAGRDGFRTPRLIGASVDLTPFLPQGARVDALLFGEIQSRVLVTCPPLDVGKILERARILGVPAIRIGTVGGEQLVIRLGDRSYAAPVRDLYQHWWDAISIAMQ